ncbi:MULTISPECIES: helix-turn-helix transcriptional regulator [Luteimonas]|uniref:helix-turn-helix transcriptional regulator n=1 Tax=Luteimonas TaxID=83614 RepID=UPI000C7D7BA4|nr:MULTISPECIES: PAS domain-containing protein [Luteimonas]
MPKRHGGELDLAAYESVADAIAALFRPHVEVVIHDLSTLKIAHIANPLSGRRAGDSSADDRFPETTLEQAVIGPYRMTSRAGRNLRSVTAVLRDRQGSPRGMMCINFDVSLLENVQASLASLAFLPGFAEPRTFFHDTWRQTLEQIVQTYEAEVGVPVTSLDAAGRTILVQRIDEARILDVRNAAPAVAARLGISRASLYKYLKNAR